MNGVNGLWQLYEDLMTHIHHTQITLNRLYLRVDSVEQLLIDHCARTNNTLNRRYIIRSRNQRSHDTLNEPVSNTNNTPIQPTSLASNGVSTNGHPENVVLINTLPTNTSVDTWASTDNTGSDLLEHVLSNIMSAYLTELSQPNVDTIGITSSDIERYITTKEYHEINEPTAINCPITMEPLLPHTRVMRINACGHVFSETGIRPWLAIRRHCPVCRHAIAS